MRMGGIGIKADTAADDITVILADDLAFAGITRLIS